LKVKGFCEEDNEGAARILNGSATTSKVIVINTST